MISRFVSLSRCNAKPFACQGYRFLFTRVWNNLNALVKEERSHESVEIMEQQGIPLSRDNAYCLLQKSGKMKDLECGRRVQFLMIQSGIESVEVLGNHLIRLFAFFGCVDDANRAFNMISRISIYTWTGIISTHANVGQEMVGIQLQSQMQQSGVDGDKYAYLAVLKACASTCALKHGRHIHDQIIEQELQLDVVVGNTLVNMYAKCGSLEESCKVFYALPDRDVVSWGAMLTAYVQHDKGHFALECYQEMVMERVLPDKITFNSILKACSSIGAIDQGKLIHANISKLHLDTDLAVGSTLVDMYGKCGCLKEARKVFDQLQNHDIVSWDAMIAGYAQHGEGHLALNCFQKMQEQGIKPDKLMFPSILKACASIKVIEEGRLVHELILKHRFQSDGILGNILVDMYAKCGSMAESHKVFSNLQRPDVISWGAMISGYAQHGEDKFAFETFEKMVVEGVKPDKVTFTNILKVCSSQGDIEQGRLIHGQFLTHGLVLDDSIGIIFVDMYAKCSSLEESLRIFNKLPNRNLMSWGAMITGCVDCGQSLLALEVFLELQEERLKPDKVMFLSILRACGTAGTLEQGRLVHCQVVRDRTELDVVLGSTMVDMYAKCGSLEEAHQIFDKLADRNVVSWNAMIGGYAQDDDCIPTLHCFDLMHKEGIIPDQLTFPSILKVCGNAGSIEQGRLIHDQILSFGFETDIIVGNTIVYMYAKCGSLEDSYRIFNRLQSRNVVSWGAMIGAYAQRGEGLLAIDCFQKMQEQQITPNKVTFLGIIIACSRTGFVDEGRWYLKHMDECYGMTPEIDHYSCMIDLLGREGCLQEAEDLLHAIKHSNLSSWVSLLNACRMHGNVALARRCFEEVIQLEPHFAPGYVLMSNIYADFHRRIDQFALAGLDVQVFQGLELQLRYLNT